MQPFLGLFFFSMLLATGASLECESCTGPGTHCTGPKVPCHDLKDTCVVSFTKASVDKNVEITWKGCESSKICGSEPITMSIGKGKIRTSSVVCCTGDACKSVTPELPPPVNSKGNGRQCPSCYTLTGKCPRKVVNCKGSEDHCFVMVTDTITGGIKGETTVEGCTTAQFCAHVDRMSPDMGIVGAPNSRAGCSTAPLVSQAPPSTVFSLLALSGLLVMKMLF